MLRTTIRLLLIAGLLFAGFGAMPAANLQAQEVVLGETSVLVPANGQVSIQFETFCLEFGRDFPDDIGAPVERAGDEVLRVLKVAIEEGYVESDPLQVQLAIWRVIEGEWVYSQDELPRDLAEEILEMAESATVEPLQGEGVAILDAVDQGLVTIESEDFTAVDAPTQQLPDGIEYKGRGTLVITNQTSEELRVFFPFGTVFDPGTETEQNIVAYATELVQEPTPTPTATPMDTPTPMPTDTPTPMPTDTPTPMPTDTPTPMPTDTPTPMPTDTPTPVPTDTPAPTATPTLEPAPEMLPETGASLSASSRGAAFPLWAMLLGLGIVGGSGFFWLRRRR
jgi:outer membrane biosynthesis protein TonB